MNNATVHIIPIGLFFFFSILLLFYFNGPKKIPEDAKALVKTFVQSEVDLDYNTLKKLYAFRAVVNIQRVYKDGSPSEDIEVYASQIIKIAKGAKKIAKELNDYNEYSDIEYEWLNKKNIKVSTLRYSKSKPAKTPHILILAQDKKKNWLILEEYILEVIE